jgi:hypothetical protein
MAYQAELFSTPHELYLCFAYVGISIRGSGARKSLTVILRNLPKTALEIYAK